jgi:hypothetical protein
MKLQILRADTREALGKMLQFLNSLMYGVQFVHGFPMRLLQRKSRHLKNECLHLASNAKLLAPAISQ